MLHFPRHVRRHAYSLNVKTTARPTLEYGDQYDPPLPPDAPWNVVTVIVPNGADDTMHSA